MSDPFQLMLLEDLNIVSWNHNPRGRKRNWRSFFFSSNKDLRCARMTRAKKQLAKRVDIGRAELRKSVRFEGGVPGQSDFCAIQNAGLAEEDHLELDFEKEDSISEDLPTVSALRDFCI